MLENLRKTPNTTINKQNPYFKQIEDQGDFTFHLESFDNLLRPLSTNFPIERPLCLEIGFGFGDFCSYLLDLKKYNYVGIEQKIKRTAKLAKKVQLYKENLKLINSDANLFLNYIPDEKFADIFCFFPDPWPKRRHNKHRLLNAAFIEKCVSRLTVGGKIYIKTDSDDYMKFIQQEVSKISSKNFRIYFQTNDLYKTSHESLLTDFQTHFEKIFLMKKKNINAIILERTL